MAKPTRTPDLPFSEMVTKTFDQIRADKIRAARARVPTPSYDQIAVEAGCSVRTVYNILKGLTHKNV